VDASEANFVGANLRGADLRGANLNHAKLHGSVFENANLLGAEIEYALFDDQTVLPDGIHWEPHTDLERFTQAHHIDFWQPPPLD
jgi:uncharacterized protein YjbI with pentapeptide repeats